MEAWQTLMLAFGGNAALLAVLGIIGKSLLEKLILRDTKLFESELQRKTNEHQVRFLQLHQKRAAVIAELYGLLVESLWAGESFLSPMEWVGEPTKKEKHIEANNKLAEVYRFFDKNRIYLPPDICKSLEELISNVRTQVIKFGIWVKYEESQLSPESQERKYADWDAAYEVIKTQVPAARISLEDEFRKLLGATQLVV